MRTNECWLQETSILLRKSDFSTFEEYFLLSSSLSPLRPRGSVLVPERIYRCAGGLRLAHVCLWTRLLGFSRCCCLCLNLFSCSLPELAVCRLIYAIRALTTLGSSASHSAVQCSECVCNWETFHSGVTVFYCRYWNSWSSSPRSLHSLATSLMPGKAGSWI